MLFYSPIAWFVLIVFLVQSGIMYFGSLESMATQQEMGGIRMRYLFDITNRVFLGRSGLFPHIMENLYLYIPLLTMGLISRETSSGTIKLLYSSPIKVRDVVFGKYLAMMLYSLLLLLIVALFVVTGIFHIKEADKGMLITSLLGFYLLLCAYSAIGLFMSCLTTYQIVAAVCTFVMIGALSYIGSVWQQYDFFRDITYYLSIAGRTEKMLYGLVTSKDVIYFLVIISIFLGLSIYKLRSGMESKPAVVKAGRYVAVVAVGLLIGYISSLPQFIAYYDATVYQRNTVLPNVQKIIEELGDEPLAVTTYNNVLAGSAQMGYDRSYNMIQSTWERYIRFKKGSNIIVHKAINYYDSTLDNEYMMRGYTGKNIDEIAQQITKANKMSLKGVKTPAEIKKIIDLRPEMNRFVMQLKYKDKTTFLRIFDDQQVWPSETEVSAAFKRLMQARLPKVGFLTGHLERNIFRKGDREYARIATAKAFRYSLINQGFDVDTLTVETQQVPEDISVLVIADPKLELSPAAVANVKQYIDRGGNLVVTCEPGKEVVMQPILDLLGVQLMQGRVIQEDKDRAPDMVQLSFTKKAGSLSKYVEDMRVDTMGEKLPVSGVAGLAYADAGPFTVAPLLQTDGKLSWNRVQPLDPDLMTSAVGGGVVMMGGSSYGTEDEVVDAPAPPAPKTGQKPGSGQKPAIAPGQMPAGSSVRPATRPTMPAPGKTVDKTRPAAMIKATVVQPGSDAASFMTVADRGGRSQPIGSIMFSPQDGDTRGPITTAVALSRKVNGKEQRIMVSGDADFMRNGAYSTAGHFFTTGVFSWLAYEEFPIDSYRPKTKDNAILATSDQVGMLRTVYLWVLPLLLAAGAAVLLIRRKRK